MPKTMARHQHQHHQQLERISSGMWLERYVLGARTFLFPGQVGLWHARDTLASGTEASPEEVGLLFLKTRGMLQTYLKCHGGVEAQVLRWHEARSPGVVYRSDGTTDRVAVLRESGGSGRAKPDRDDALFFPGSAEVDSPQLRQASDGAGFACCMVLARGEGGDEDEAKLLASDENHGSESAAGVHQGSLVDRLIKFLSPSFVFHFVSALEFRANCECGCALCGQQQQRRRQRQAGSTKMQIANAHGVASHSSSSSSSSPSPHSKGVPTSAATSSRSLPPTAATISLSQRGAPGRQDLPQGDPAPAIDIAPSLSLDDLRAHLDQSEGRSFAQDQKAVVAQRKDGFSSVVTDQFERRTPDPSCDVLARLQRTIEAQSRHITKLEEQIRTTTAERDKLRADRAEMDSRLSATTFLNETFLSGMMSGT